MRYFLLVFFLSGWGAFLFAQADPPNVKSDPEYKKAFKSRDYDKAKALLEVALNQNPNDPELHYFMSYTIDKINDYESKDPLLYHDLTFVSSEYMEKVIELSPKYEGEIYALDPYEKISSIWGSQALHYLVFNKSDSAVWAFEQGRDRGGFQDATVQFGENMLSSCEKNSILLCSGDITTYALMYAQSVLKHRNDVLVLNIHLLNEDWYIEYIQRQVRHPALNQLKLLGYPKFGSIDTRELQISTPNCGSQKTYNWSIQPTYESDQYFRSNLILIDLIQTIHNQYPIRFTPGFSPGQTLGLYDKIRYVDLAGRLHFCSESAIEKESKLCKLDIDNLNNPTIQNSPGTVSMLQFYRMAYLNMVQYYLDHDKPKKAEKFFQKMKKTIPVDYIPVVYESFEFIIQDLEEQFDEK